MQADGARDARATVDAFHAEEDPVVGDLQLCIGVRAVDDNLHGLHFARFDHQVDQALRQRLSMARAVAGDRAVRVARCAVFRNGVCSRYP